MQNLENTELQSTNSANPISLQSQQQQSQQQSSDQLKEDRMPSSYAKTSHSQHLRQPSNTMISRTGSFGSISSISSISSYHSSNTNQQNDEIFENVENEATSTHSFPQRKHSDDTQQSHDDHPNDHDIPDHDEDDNDHHVITPSPDRQTPVISPQIISTKHSLTQNNNGNSNNNTSSSLIMHEPEVEMEEAIEPSNIMLTDHDLSPHISALTKLHLNDNSLTNKTLTPSPNDPHNNYNATQLQHQDIKHQQSMASNQRQTDLHSPTMSRSSMSSITNVLWSSLQTVNHYLPYTNTTHSNSARNVHEDDPNLTDIDPNLTDTGDYDDDEKKEDDPCCHHRQSGSKQGYIQSNTNITSSSSPSASYTQHHHSLQSIMNSPQFMDNAIAMYGQLDHALTNINNLKSQQLQQIQSLKQRRKKKRRQIYSNIERHHHHDLQNDDNEHRNDDNHEHLDVNQHVVGVMKTLISSTTEMGSFFTASPSDSQSQLNDSNNDNNDQHHHTPHSPTTSIIGQLLDKLSSSVAYMSYISVATITPYVYNVVEAILIELYSTIKDIIEYYDPDPKNNILWRIINKMNEIIEAIRGLLALSDCFYEISSDHDDNDEDDEDEDDEDDYDDAKHKNHSYSFFMNNRKEKED